MVLRRAVAVAVLLFATGCTPKGSVEPAAITRLSAAQTGGRDAFVATATAFVVKLDRALDTGRTKPGQSFTATVTQPLVASDGRVLVPAGAQVRGSVISVNADRAFPSLALGLQTIETTEGIAPLQARVIGASAGELYEPNGGYDALFYPPSASYASPHEVSRNFRIPEGTTIRLELTEPIWSPP